jgi:nucleotide-binding universal stress UspA family protein
VAVDGSEHGKKAARAAGEMARQHYSDLWVVVAYDVLPKYFGEPNLQEALTHRLDQSEETYVKTIQEIGKNPYSVHKEILEGPAAEAILSVANMRGVDLIIIGREK